MGVVPSPARTGNGRCPGRVTPAAGSAARLLQARFSASQGSPGIVVGMESAVIVDVIRTASGKGKPGGALSGTHPADLLAAVLRGLVDRNGLDPERVDDVIAGCVTQCGDQAANVARTAVLAAGLPESIPATTLDRQCGSSQQAAHFAAQGVIAGAYDVVVAAGVECMTRTPMGSSMVQGLGFPFGPKVMERYAAVGGMVPQ